jgi:hypothetical protein
MRASMTASTRDLLLEIAKCPNVVEIFKGAENHPCSEIVRSQGSSVLDNFQVPEPWNGCIDKARLLYLSSNPSISEIELYPTWNWSEERLEDFFNHRFGGGNEQWVKNGKRAMAKDGSYLDAQSYWSEIINRSQELYGRQAIPGIDYTITEIVHCKSKNMIGVKSALGECSGRYLQRVLQASGASVIVVVGQKATDVLRVIFKSSNQQTILGPQIIAGRERVILFLPAPGSSKPRKIDKVLTPDELSLVRSYLV